MKDTIIINTISKIHSIIVSTLLFIFLTLSLLFIILQNGVNIENISLPNIQVEKLYIKWNEKLDINIDEVKIIENSKKIDSKINLQKINEVFKYILLFDNWFEAIQINNINFNNVKASFKYAEGEKGFLVASSENFSIKSSLFFESHFFNAKIEEFHDYKRNIDINGNIIFDGHYNLEFLSDLNISINNDIKLKAYAIANKEKLYYSLKSKDKIKKIKHTLDMLNIPEEVMYWISDAIKSPDFSLKSAYGWLEYDKLDEAYKNIYVLANANNLIYTYNPELEPVITKYTELEYKNGVLYIRPKEAYQYGFFLDKSWLKIDFTKKEELLTLFLLFNGKVNNDLLNLLKSYDIKLPFVQNSGDVKTNLKIEVGLQNLGVSAKGDFYTKKSNFTYLGLNIDILDARVFLNNYKINIKKMHSKYKDIATADVDVVFNAKTNEGKIDFLVEDINLKELGVKLKKSSKPLEVSYIISNSKDIINAKSSKWEVKDKVVDIDNLSIGFDLDSLVATIPTTALKIEDFVSAYASGTFSLDPVKIDLDIDLLKLSLKNIKMNQSIATLKAKYDKDLLISLKDSIRFTDNSLDYTISNATVKIDENAFSVLNGAFNIDDLVNTSLNANYSFKTKNGHINLNTLNFKNKKLGEIFTLTNPLHLDINTNSDRVKIAIKDFDVESTFRNTGWNINFKSLGLLSKKSKLLQDYNITNGNLVIYKIYNYKNIRFSAKTKYPYKFLALGDKLVEDYSINGEFNNENKRIKLNINNLIDVKIGNSIRIKAKNVGINTNEIINYLYDRNSTSEESKSKSVVVNATDSYIYISKDRHVISDTIELQYFNDILSAQLRHQKGKAGFKLKDGKFYFYGKDFNDQFMNSLFALSKFKGGDFSFSIAGTTKEYDGLLHVKNTTMLDYKILNNVLAFINTIPSLVTFSIPGYNTQGLEVESAYTNFHTKNDVFDIKALSIDSKEINIVGKGTANYKNNTVDLKLNLKTDLGSVVSKIPVVGYILLGKDAVSTTVEVNGELDNPNVKSLIAQDIAVAPFNIIKRTLLLPFHLFDDDEEEAE